MYGNALYGSALYGSNGTISLQFIVSPAKSDAQALPYDMKQTVSVAIALSNAQALSISIDSVWIVAQARSNAQAIPLDGIVPTGFAYFDPTLSQSHFKANEIAYNSFFDLSTAKSDFRAIKPNWVTIVDVPKAVSNSQSKKFDWQLYMNPAKALSDFSSNAVSSLTFLDIEKAISNAGTNPITWILFFDPATGKSEMVAGTIGYTVTGTAYFDPFVPNANVNSNIIEFKYAPVEEIPDLNAKRNANFLSADIDVLNPIPSYFLTIYRTDDHIGESVEIASIAVPNLPYNDLTDLNGNYRYVGAYSLPGNIGGVPVKETGNESSPRITIGKNRSLT